MDDFDQPSDDFEEVLSSDSSTISDQFLTWIASLESEGYRRIDILSGLTLATCDLLCKMQDD